MSTKILKTIIFNDPVIFLLGIYHKEITRNLNEDLHKFDVKFKHYFQYKKDIYNIKGKKSRPFQMAQNRELEMIKYRYIIVNEYYKAIQNVAFEEYLITCENKFFIV